MSHSRASLLPVGKTHNSASVSSPNSIDNTVSGGQTATLTDAGTNKAANMADIASENIIDGQSETSSAVNVPQAAVPVVETKTTASTNADNVSQPTKSEAKESIKAKQTKVRTRSKKLTKRRASTTSEYSSSSTSSDESEATSSSTESEITTRHRKAKSRKARVGRAKKGKRNDDDSSTDSSEGSTSSDDEKHVSTAKGNDAKKLKKLRVQLKTLQAKYDADSDTTSESSDSEDVKKSKGRRKRKAKKDKRSATHDSQEAPYDSTRNPNRRTTRVNTESEPAPKVSAKQAKKDARAERKAEAKRKALKGTKLQFVRVDRLWDYDQHAYITRETKADHESGEYDEYVFNVRRIFDWENRHESTVVDIKSKVLKEALIKVMGDVKGISLAEETPSIDPNMIFLYLEELRTYMEELEVMVSAKKKNMKKGKAKKKTVKELTVKRKALKVLVKYLDKDYDETKKSLYPMLETGTITFNLLWALFKSNEIVFAPTYGADQVPRAFKVEYANPQKSLIKGPYYEVEGKYLDYNGAIFGKGDCEYIVEHFKGPRKITSLSCYPIKYHRNHDALREQLISRGKEFVALKGMLYKMHKGMAFYKKPNNQIVKVNVDGRVMVDPANFRRINPNYQVSTIKPEDPDLLPDDDCCDANKEEDQTDSDDDSDQNQFDQHEIRKKNMPKTRKKLVKDSDDDLYVVEVAEEVQGNEIKTVDGENVETAEDFTEDDYLIASPVVLGFSFGHKLWVELDVAGLKEIQWNEGAFDSLVIPDDQKDVVKALVESHSYSASKNIDDVIQGKGQGLVAVLHGPPGTGKTLTAEGIAELLRKPLYMVSVGELGIKGGDLEKNFSQIIDIAHCWGALLLLDEADVFLEKRELHDISRNALVSIFLRLLEYFQGILFLTTNRVVTFDEAFASRIHIGLRYGELSLTAKKNVWRLFLDKVRALPGVDVDPFTEANYAKLAQYQLNGREIKNSVRTAQSLACIEKRALSMEHLLKVLFVGNVFAKDLKGPGYEEALKFYM